MRSRARGRSFALVLVMLAGAGLYAQQPKPSVRNHQVPAPPASARLWRSQTTGKEYRVWTDNEQLYAEWVNIPPEIARRGASIRIECRRAGSKWVGTAHNQLPCDTNENGKRVTNFCRLTTKIEFAPLEANRITGRTEWARRFDCANCKILDPVWADFEWVLKEESAVPGRP